MEVLKRIFVPDDEISRIQAGTQTARIILRPVHVAHGRLTLTSGLRAVEVEVESCLPMTVSTLTKSQLNRAGYSDAKEFDATWAGICEEQRSPLELREVTLVSLRSAA